jgi:heme exporter protein C
LTGTLKFLSTAGWLAVLATLALVAFYVPPTEVELKGNYLIFFFHFPSAICCLLFFLFAGLASIAHLVEGSAKADHFAVAAVEVGLLGCTITMVTGSIWARAAWGVFWVWDDPRLMTVAIMWFTYLGYLALRSSIDSPPQRARFAAVFGIIAMANIFLVWFAIHLFGQKSHPMKVEFDRTMNVTKLTGLGAFLVLYLAFWFHRYRIARLRSETQRLEERLSLSGL